MEIARGTVLSVNVGGVREFEYRGGQAFSAIWKSAVSGRVAVRGVNLAGDEQADRNVHGGPDKAVYAYGIEDTRWWEEQIGRSLEHGEFGENLSTKGIDVTDAIVGERWEIGSALFEVSEPRVPCWRFAVRMDDKLFPRRFTEAGRPGAYLRILREGDVGEGDDVRVVDRPDHDLTIGDVFRIFTHDRADAGRLLGVPSMSSSWQRWAEQLLERRGERKSGTTDPGCC